MQITDISDVVWMWVHQKCGMIQNICKLYSLKTNNLSYLYVPNNDWLKQRSNVTDYMQCKNSKMMIAITINTNIIIMRHSIII